MNSNIEKAQTHYDKKRHEAEEYAKRPDAKHFVIQKLNNELRLWYDILNELRSSESSDQWSRIEKEIVKLGKKDQNIGGVHVMISFNNNKTHYALLPGEYSLS